MSKITVPDVPAALRNSDDAVAQDMVGSLESSVRLARLMYQTIDRYETQADDLNKRLTESDHDDVVAWRQEQVKRTNHASELEQKIQELQAQLKSYNEESEKELAEPLAKAQAAVRTDDDVTPQAMVKAVERIRAIAKNVKSNVDLLKAFDIPVNDDSGKEFAIPVPASSTGSKSNTKGEETTFTPAFSNINLNGKDLAITKTFELAKLLKVQRTAITNAIEVAGGGSRDGWDNLEVGDTMRVNLKVTDLDTKDGPKEYVIIFTKTVKGAKDDDNESTPVVESDSTPVSEETTAA